MHSVRALCVLGGGAAQVTGGWVQVHSSHCKSCLLAASRISLSCIVCVSALPAAGFTKRSESEYDPFGAGHSSTSISAGLGMAVGRDMKGKKNNVISVIGDGAITGGMAYEAMNHAGFLDSNMVIILNDNQQVRMVLT